MQRRLSVEFSTEAAFRSEYLSNINNGGIFVATRDELAIRDLVVIELCLSYCDRMIELEGEVVHCVPIAMAEAGASPGVAVQFTLPAKELRAEFEPIVGVVEGNERISRSGRRAAPRAPARVRVVLHSETQGEINCQTRDISSSGLLLSVADQPIAVGEPVTLAIAHPQSGELMDVDGTVVRHLTTEDGTVTAMGIEFHTLEARQTEVSAFISDVRAAEHSRRLGGISGPIAEVGIENLLQMFGSSSARGTLTVTRGSEEGFIAFEGGMLCAARLGRCSRAEALKQMLSWREGNFEFHARVDEMELDLETVPLSGAILNALCSLDERNRTAAQNDDLSALVDGDPASELDLEDDLELDFDPSDELDTGLDEDGLEESPEEFVLEEEVAPSTSSAGVQPSRIQPDTAFDVDLAAADAMRAELDKTEEAVLDLALVGFSVERIVEVIPEPELDVYGAVDSLIERGLIRSN